MPLDTLRIDRSPAPTLVPENLSRSNNDGGGLRRAKRVLVLVLEESWNLTLWWFLRERLIDCRRRKRSFEVFANGWGRGGRASEVKKNVDAKTRHDDDERKDNTN